MSNNVGNKRGNLGQYIRLYSMPSKADPGYIKLFYLDGSSGLSSGFYTIDSSGVAASVIPDNIPNFNITAPIGDGEIFRYNELTSSFENVAFPGTDLGWVKFIDSQYVEVSPRYLAANTSIKLTNNKATIEDQAAPSDGASILTSGSDLIFNSLNDVYRLETRLTVEPNVNNRGFKINLLEGGEIISSSYTVLNQGAGQAHKLIASFELETNSENVLGAGTSVQVESGSNCFIYDIVFILRKCLEFDNR